MIAQISEQEFKPRNHSEPSCWVIERGKVRDDGGGDGGLILARFSPQHDRGDGEPRDGAWRSVELTHMFHHDRAGMPWWSSQAIVLFSRYWLGFPQTHAYTFSRVKLAEGGGVVWFFSKYSRLLFF